MRFVGLIGLVALLALAWGLSVNRRGIKLRPVLWGLGLQFLFAVIILQENAWSFVGMALLAMLIVAFIFRHDIQDSPKPAVVSAIIAGGALITGALLVFISQWISLTTIMMLVIVIMIFNTYQLHRPLLSRELASVLVVGLVAMAIAGGSYGQIVFKGFSDNVAAFLNLSSYGAAFLFGNLVDTTLFFPADTSTWPGFGFQFAFRVLPTIIFFGGFMAVLYYLGIMQYIIDGISRFMRWTIGTSGAETLSCSANIFVGQTEAPLLIKPFLNDMTRSELLTIMVGGFATVAGGVLAGYIAMGIDPGHLVAASVMSAPAALAVAKIIYPEDQHSTTAGDVDLPPITSGTNVVDAASNGIVDGLKLAVNVGAMLIGFIALIAVADVILNGLDRLIDGIILKGPLVAYTTTSGLSPVVHEYAGIFPGSLKTLFGTLLRPLAFLMGVSWADAAEVGNLLGIKLTLNEFVAFGTLGSYQSSGALEPKSIIIATYALTGFANFSSIGIQIGGIGALAPKRHSDISSLATRAMFGGAIASFITATVAGMLL